MKSSLIIPLLFLVQLSFSQKNLQPVSLVDRKQKASSFTHPEVLAKQLTESATTDLEKMRSIFHWVTGNIAYKTRPLAVSRRASKYTPHEPEDDTDSSTSLNERIALEVLKNREAVCDGYARLLKTLCEYSGLRCEIITGYARSNINRVGSSFKSNHRWNAVWLDSSWYLMDATWASGYISNGLEQFVKAYDDHYFMTPPETFIRDHYPEDARWTLLAHPPTLQEFYRTPFKHSAFSKYSIASFEPAKGVIEASIGDTIKVELTMAYTERKAIAPDTLKEELEILPALYGLEAVIPYDSSATQKINYHYAIVSDNIGWLNIIYNQDVVLRYKLNVRRKEDN